MKNIAIVTGASSGIGLELARIIDKKEAVIDEIWLLGKNESRLKKLSNRLIHKTKIIKLDLANPKNIAIFKKIINNEDIDIKILVNSAGFGIDGEFENNDYRKIKEMLRLNIEALTLITYNCLPYMSYGARIINMASAAAYMPQPYFALYAASKSYVLSFSRAIREELRDRKIDVLAVTPGPVKTRFFNKLENADEKLSFIKKESALEVALTAYKDSLNGKSISVYGSFMKLFMIMTKILPIELLIRGYVKFTDVKLRNTKRSK